MAITLLVPADYLTEVVTLIDYIGWANITNDEEATRTLSDDAIACAKRVWDQVGDEPDYELLGTAPTWDVMYAIKFKDYGDAQVMVDALNDYISKIYTHPDVID